MDNRQSLEKLSKNFSREDLTLFLRAASGKFKPEKADYSHYLDKANFVRDLQKLGWIEFDDSRRLIVLAGELDAELNSQSGKLRQYEIAKQVLKNENFDAGIFVFHDSEGHFRFSWITAQYTGTKREFSSFRRYTYFVSSDQPARTFVEYIGKEKVFESIEKITEAFSVEPVTRDFFKAYRRIFEEAEATIKLKWMDEKKRLYTQRFFNRLMFLAFLERKGWLVFNGRRDYLKALFADYDENENDKRATFHRSRLNVLFFMGLNHPSGDKRNEAGYKPILSLIGDVPYLNGGLFEQEVDDEQYFFPDPIVAKILKELVYQFNFTVTESTPLDVEVAVDPEMLGRIFEELVTGRHESGSYYTPKPVVAFMCREALKGYLGTAMPSESAEALASFVDKNDASELRNPELALNALRTVKVCDPASGSGAYLLGMLHELLEQRECLFVKTRLDARNVYERKLEIIQNNLYGVDKDDFAVNIARLRLWLSLVVDDTRNPLEDPTVDVALPNLDFKIESGDSLTAPDPSGGLQPDMFRQQQVQEFLTLKNEFMDLHAGSEKKKKLAEQIQELRMKIEEWAHPKGYDKTSNSFDWQVDFAEVFAPELAQSTLGGKMMGIVNAVGGQMEMTDAPKEGGFDIILANPPYVRHELLGDYKELLKPIFPEVYNGTADLYVYFYARAHQLLRNGGVACFISSNKWLKAGYGEKLRQHLLDKQNFGLVADFGDLPVFQSAMAYPCIFLWQKAPREQNSTLWAEIKDLEVCYEEGIREYVSRIAISIPAPEFGANKPRLSKINSSTLKTKVTLQELLVDGMQILSGIKTGLNEAFVIGQDLRNEFVSKHKSCSEILKPLLVGEDVRSYEIHFKNQYLIWSYTGIDITKYPPIYNHLKKYKQRLENRTDQFTNWWELRPCDYYDLFEKPKIIYPQVMKEPRFFLDNDGYFTNQKCYFFPLNDFFVLGLLNSSTVWNIIKEHSPILQGGYSEPRRDFMLTLPIPDAPQKERDAVAKLAKQVQSLHTQRRKRVEKFLREIGLEPAESNSRNPLESPWALEESDFVKRATKYGTPNVRLFKSAREETLSVTEEIVKVEKEIDERVKGLYGV